VYGGVLELGRIPFGREISSTRSIGLDIRFALVTFLARELGIVSGKLLFHGAEAELMAQVNDLEHAWDG